MSSLIAAPEAKNPRNLFVWFACGKNSAAFWVSFALCGVVAFISANIFEDRNYSQVGYPGPTTLKINMYVPEKLQAGSFDPNRAVAIEDVSLEDFKKKEKELPYIFSSRNVQQNWEGVTATVSYYAKSENGTHVYRTSIEKKTAVPESAEWRFELQNYSIQPWGIQVNGCYKKTDLRAIFVGTALFVAFVFCVAIHFSANRWLKKRYPNWRSY